jgi:tRNA A-37 threonylcarbamoyl transferase component Bud32/outer membrane protein assembly factor BamB
MSEQANDSDDSLFEFAVREQRLHEVLHAYLQAVDAGQAPDRQELLRRHPELAAELEAFFADQEKLDRLARPQRPEQPAASPTAPPEAPTIAPGEPAAVPAGPPVRSFGDYELLAEIARGGMGVVWMARQVSLKRIVALKMILAGELADEADVRRFQMEAQTAANLQHPNIVAIHEVGRHEGQDYFSMEYVKGASLADLVRDNPLPPARAAAYIQTVAEAIDYAHRRGILHRDLKPANVLIDTSDQPRVTDFGLAKRIDRDTGLTASGAVVGTPSYMPPEQASGQRGKLGPASDVYSLGAVLYELVTGRPPFRAATQMDTLLQVLEAEPAPPRLLNPGVGRDLETIILKCLAKEPAKRYATAQELADDLAAFREGRPIKARRPRLAERAIRWVRKQRRSAVLAAVAALVSAGLVVGGIFAWGWYQKSLQGEFVLTTDGLAYDAEVLDEHGRVVLGPFTAPTRQPVSLPAGMYRLRLSAEGHLSETYQLLVERGVQRRWKVGLGDRQLWEPLDVPASFEVVELEGRADVILVSEKGVRRVDGRTGKDVWPGGTRSLEKKDQPKVGDVKRYDWVELFSRIYQRVYQEVGGAGRAALAVVELFSRMIYERAYQPKVAEVKRYDWSRIYQEGWFHDPSSGYRRSPCLVRPAPDLDGDGVGDLVWASRNGPWLLAVSGKDGRVLWWFSDPLGGVNGCPPLVVEDLDGDGTPDVIAVGNSSGEEPKGWVQAISGRTGQPLWRYQSPHLANPRGWVQVLGRGVSMRYELDQLVFPGHALTVFGAPGNRILAVAVGSNVMELDLRTGKPVRLAGRRGQAGEQPTLQLDPEPGLLFPYTLPVFADLGGNGQSAALLLAHGKEKEESKLIAVSLTSGRRLWEHPMSCWGTEAGTRLAPTPENQGWPVAADLDGDGRPEVIVPYNGYDPKNYGRNGWVGLEVLDGRTGRSRWRCRLSRAEGGPEGERRGTDIREPARFLVGPDLDGDGCRDILTASLIKGSTLDSAEDSRSRLLLVAAVSGKDGRILWRRLQPLPGSDFLSGGSLGPLLQWPAGPDGWPRLAVTYSFSGKKEEGTSGSDPNTSQTFLFSVADGTLQHACHGLSALGTADLNGDGLADLYGLRLEESGASGKLHAFQGGPPEPWRRLGTWQPEIGGRFPVGHSSSPYVSPARHGDLDGDGTPDVLVFHPAAHPPSPLQAFSGKDGHPLWRADWIENQEWITRCYWLDCRDLNGDGRPQVLIAYLKGAPELRWEPSFRGSGGGGWGNGVHSLWLAKLSGRTGQGWQTKLGAGFLQEESRETIAQKPTFRPGLADLNGDGVLDLIVCSHPEGEAPRERKGARISELLAVDGRDGHFLWRQPLPSTSDWQSYFPALALSKPGKDGSVVVHVASGNTPLVSAWDGRTGQQLWGWADNQWLRPENDHCCPTPVVADLDGTGACSVCVPVRRGKRNLLVILGPDGKERRALAVRPSAPDRERFQVWSGDLDGDGKDELVFLSDGKVRAVRGDGRPIWKEDWPLPAGGDILAVLPAAGRHGASVAVGSGNAVYGLDGRTGRLSWRCDGPGRATVVLSAAPPGGLPTVLFGLRQLDATVCRQALPVDAPGKYVLLTPTPWDYGPPPEDPWLTVPLPWVKWAKLEMARLGIRHGLVPGVIGGVLLFLAWRRRWKSIMGLLLALLIGVVFFGAIMMTIGPWGRLKEPEQSYSWDGWYWIGPFILTNTERGFPWVVLGLSAIAWGFVALVYRGVRLAHRGVRRILSRPSRPRTTTS